jgi:hypothetical protein
MRALAAFATPVAAAIFAIGVACAPLCLVLLWFVAIGWFIALIQVERAKQPRLIEPNPTRSSRDAR